MILPMSEKPTSVKLNPADQQIVRKIKRYLEKELGNVTFTDIVRRGIRVLAKELGL